MNILPQLLFLSAESTLNSREENLRATQRLMLRLDEAGYRYKRVKGVYKDSIEDSFCIVLDNANQVSDLNFIAFSNFNQESTLYVDANRKAQLQFSSGDIQELGSFKAIEKSEVKNHSSYTYDVTLDQYYACI